MLAALVQAHPVQHHRKGSGVSSPQTEEEIRGQPAEHLRQGDNRIQVAHLQVSRIQVPLQLEDPHNRRVHHHQPLDRGQVQAAQRQAGQQG